MLYVVYKDGNEDYVCTTDTIDFHSELKKNGAVIMDESSFIPIITNPGYLSEKDTIMIHVSMGQEVTRIGLKHFAGRKVLFTIDECKSDGMLFRTHREFCEQIDCKEMILSYPPDRNIKFLEDLRYRTIAYNPSNVIRQKKNKKYDVLISGQLDRTYYPTRVHVAETLLKNQKRWNIIHLPHPGFERSKASHQYTGEKYRELLDECMIGVTCKAGWRDRLVAKYIELGASWCLPIGDAPSYMNEGMRDSMILVDQNSSEDEIVRKIDEALNNIESRTEQYVSTLRSHHDLPTNVRKLCEELMWKS